jgi:hypothetical protein
MLFTEFDKPYSSLQTNTLREFPQNRKQTDAVQERTTVLGAMILSRVTEFNSTSSYDSSF